jgi:formylglycine-generating enzyme required for sulfatase activity
MRRLALLSLTIFPLFFGSVFCFGQKPDEPKPAKSLTLDLGSGVKLEFILIPAGSFVMGTDENSGDGDEFPAHKVVITQPFYLGKYEVTQEQWTQLTGQNPSRFKGPKLPVEIVSWNDCHKFLRRLHEKTGRSASLPTEAQWEYAARAGTTTPWSFGATETHIADFAWFVENAENTTHPVGTKKPNAWGLYDMSGNVWEWCTDRYQKHAYPEGEAIDPQGPTTGDSYIARGGAWGDTPEMLRSTARNCAGPDVANQGIGFRCVIPVISVVH